MDTFAEIAQEVASRKRAQIRKQEEDNLKERESKLEVLAKKIMEKLKEQMGNLATSWFYLPANVTVAISSSGSDYYIFGLLKIVGEKEFIDYFNKAYSYLPISINTYEKGAKEIIIDITCTKGYVDILARQKPIFQLYSAEAGKQFANKMWEKMSEITEETYSIPEQMTVYMNGRTVNFGNDIYAVMGDSYSSFPRLNKELEHEFINMINQHFANADISADVGICITRNPSKEITGDIWCDYNDLYKIDFSAKLTEVFNNIFQNLQASNGCLVYSVVEGFPKIEKVLSIEANRMLLKQYINDRLHGAFVTEVSYGKEEENWCSLRGCAHGKRISSCNITFKLKRLKNDPRQRTDDMHCYRELFNDDIYFMHLLIGRKVAIFNQLVWIMKSKFKEVADDEIVLQEDGSVKFSIDPEWKILLNGKGQWDWITVKNIPDFMKRVLERDICKAYPEILHVSLKEGIVLVKI